MKVANQPKNAPITNFNQQAEAQQKQVEVLQQQQELAARMAAFQQANMAMMQKSMQGLAGLESGLSGFLFQGFPPLNLGGSLPMMPSFPMFGGPIVPAFVPAGYGYARY